MTQKRLTIHRTMDPDAARAILEILVECPLVPTFQIQRRDDGNAELYLSKRTYDYLYMELARLKREGLI